MMHACSIDPRNACAACAAEEEAWEDEVPDTPEDEETFPPDEPLRIIRCPCGHTAQIHGPNGCDYNQCHCKRSLA